ncbi:MAG: AGE family epimerase/isomerase [Clostridia bacterium]|nr:AGE family epimerase/isomerase [Clostridia bacterium]
MTKRQEEKLKQYKERFLSELRDKVMPFWLENGPDREYGGILHCLDADGSPFSLDKGVWMQGRAGWMFSYMYNNIEKNEEYLRAAVSCIDFARDRCFLDDGRMSLTVGQDGEVVSEQGDGWFSEAFYISACAEYYRATGDREYLAASRDCYDSILERFRVSTATPCEENEQVKRRRTRAFAQPMILLNVTNTLRECDPDRAEYYNGAADMLIPAIKAHHSEEYRATLEAIAPDGSIILSSANSRITTPGHVIECVWFLLDEATKRGDGELISFAEVMFNEAFDIGYDRKYGGILYNRDIFGGSVEAYEQDMKIWWVHNEAIISSLYLFLVTGKDRYFEIFEEMMDYSFSHFRHSDTGEWYSSLHRDGTPGAPDILGFLYKGPFHVPRMHAKCYLLLEKYGI